MTRIRFMADADLRQTIVTGIIRRQPDLDFESANQAGLESLEDSDGLAIAARKGRLLVSHDQKTMPAAFGALINSQRGSGVLIISQNLPVREAITGIILIWEASTAEEWVNQIMTLPF
jgi:hypothetical protein